MSARGAGAVAEGAMPLAATTGTSRSTTRLADTARSRSRLVVVVLLLGGLVTAAISLATWVAHGRNEDRLLDQRTREAAAVLGSAIPSIQLQLASVAELVEATNGDPAAFSEFISSSVGPDRPFISASLWRSGSSEPRPVVTVGEEPSLAGTTGAEVRTALARAEQATGLSITNLLHAEPSPLLGYAYQSLVGDARYVVYAEAALPEDRTNVVQQGSAFDDLHYALYLGGQETDANLIFASRADLPITGRRSAQTVPFGDTEMRLVMGPNGDLGGRLMAWLPWIIVTAGVLITAGAAVMTDRLLRERTQAVRLAVENRSLYDSQRGISRTLQRSLLPSGLPATPNIDVAVRYEAGAEGVDIGGDWYDVVAVGDDQLFVTIGDVSGRGLRAASTMAYLRFATRAYLAEGHSPTDIVSKLAALLDIGHDGHFATVLCALIDVDARRITIANAGHPTPVIAGRGRARLAATKVGFPVGLRSSSTYEATIVDVEPGDTFLVFTDGLFERRGESVDVGLARVCDVARDTEIPLDRLLDRLMSEVATHEHDDTAILGVRWLR